MASSFSSADYTPEEYERLVQIRTRKMQLLNEIQVLQEELVKTNECLESVNANSTEQSASKSRDRAMAIKKFNESPKKGLKALVDAGLVENSAGDIAKFFLLSDELKKSAIGDFLGEKEDFHLEVLQHFVRLQNFRGLAPVQAMRNFLLLFRLPGEAQKIDRIIEHFASQYCQQNPGLFDHPDTCYTLCYATIMLNTSLYNPSVKERMSLEDFMHITDSLNVSRQLVTEIFNSIKSESFKFPDDEVGNGIHSLNLNTAVFKLADKQGWLQKQGSRYRTWNRRWFVLSSRCLYYFEFPSNREPNGIIPLDGLRVRVLGCQELDSSKRPHTFELYSPNSDVIKTCKKKPTDTESRTPQQQQLAVVGQHSAYRMAAPSREEMHAWISAIQRSLNKESGLEEVLERRQRAASGGTGLALGREQRA